MEHNSGRCARASLAERGQFLATDAKVFAAEVRGFGDGREVRSSLGTVRAPALLMVGAAEDPAGEAARVARLLPEGGAVTLPGVGHIGAFLASERALPHALRVLRAGFAARGTLRPARQPGRIGA